MEYLAKSQPRATDQSWAELHLKNLSLKEARARAKLRQREIALFRGEWLSFPLPPLFTEGTRVIGLFAPRKDWDESEVRLNSANVLTAYPRTNNGGDMSFHLCTLNELEVSPSDHVLQAPASAPLVQPEVFIVPCLFADANGNRIGRGKGHYDRYLSSRKDSPICWGLLHSDYFFSEIPQDWLQPWDQKLSGFLTEKSLIPIQETIL